MEFTTLLNRTLQFGDRLVGVTQTYKHSLDTLYNAFSLKR